MTSKPKIHMLVIDDYITDVVTHAGYRALEEDRDSWRRVAEDLELRNGALNRELAALRGKTAGAEALLAAAKTKISRALGDPGKPSPLWKDDCNSAAWDIKRALEALK